MQQQESFHILVVDDEPPVADLLTRVSEKVFPEATIINTSSAQETLMYLDHQADKLPHLILLDIDLKESVSGLDLLPQLFSRFRGSVPVVVLSSLRDGPIVDQAYKRGAVAYTQKPDTLQDWKRYVNVMKDYWFNTARLPTLLTD
ncbi:hypothetical protein GCM10027341_52020 [Spirosoma knui]